MIVRLLDDVVCMGTTIASKMTQLRIGGSNVRERRILLAGVFTLGSRIANLLVTMVTVPLTYNYLSEERFGMLMTIMSFISVMSFSDFGLGLGLLNKIAEYSLDPSGIKLRKAVSSTFYFLLSLSLFAMICIASLSSNFEFRYLFNVATPVAIVEANTTVIAFFIIFFSTLPFTLVSKFQLGKQEAHINEVWNILASVSSLPVLYYCVRANCGVLGMLLATYGVKSLFTIFQFVYVFCVRETKYFPDPRLINWSIFSSIARDGFVFLILQFMAMLVVSADSVIISLQLSASHVAVYSIAYRLYSIFMTPVQAFSTAILPAMNDAVSKQDVHWIRKSIRRAFSLILGISVLLATMYVCFGNLVVHLWISPEVDIPLSMLIAFAVYIVISNVQDFLSPVMMSPKNLRVLLMIYVPSACVIVACKCVVLHFFETSSLIYVGIFGLVGLYFVPSYMYLKRIGFL